MGGIGSGRHNSHYAKNTTSDYRSIDIRQWHRNGLLTQNNLFIWKWHSDGKEIGSINVYVLYDRLVLSYSRRSDSENRINENYPVSLDWSACNYGSKRPWFICPAKDCGKRVAVLYGGNIYACRHCYELVYRSQRESAGDRAIRSAEKIRTKLDWDPGILNGVDIKPKGMHWRTFERLVEEHETKLSKSLSSLMRHFLVKY